MSKETKEAKAIRYLITGRVAVYEVLPEYDYAMVYVTGDTGGEPYNVTRTDGQWACDCPAQVTCAHILACKAIIPSTGVKVDEETGASLDAILDG